MKRISVAALIIALVLCFSVTAYASEIYTEGTLYYTVEDNSITIVGCFGRDEVVTVPASIAGTPVNTIASGAFADNKYVKTVRVPDTVTNIEEGAMGNADVEFIGGSGPDESEAAVQTPAPTAAAAAEESSATAAATSTPAPAATATPAASSQTVASSSGSSASSVSSGTSYSYSTSTSTGDLTRSGSATAAASDAGAEPGVFETDVYIDETGEISEVVYDSSFIETVQAVATEEQYSAARLIMIAVLAAAVIILAVLHFTKHKKTKSGRH